MKKDKWTYYRVKTKAINDAIKRNDRDVSIIDILSSVLECKEEDIEFIKEDD